MSLRWRKPPPTLPGGAKRGKLRRFAQFYDAAHSWSRVERIIARVEAGPEGTDTRFIVTNLEGGRAKHLYKGSTARAAGRRTTSRRGKPPRCRPNLLPRGRGQPVPPVPARRRLLAVVVDATPDAAASAWRVMQFDTLRLRLLKLAARVVELKKQVKIYLPSSSPDQAIFAMLLDRLPRLITENRGMSPSAPRNRQHLVDRL